MAGIVLFLFVFVVCYLIIRVLLKRDKRSPARIAYYGKSFPFSEITPDPNFPHLRSLHTKIRGVTKRNPDGASRQGIIGQCCHSGDALFLIREPKNPVDPNAIVVRRVVYSDVPDKPRLGEQLGYLSRELAEELAPQMDNGSVLFAWIKTVTGGDAGRSLGVNIQIEEYKASAAQPGSKGFTLVDLIGRTDGASL